MKEGSGDGSGGYSCLKRLFAAEKKDAETGDPEHDANAEPADSNAEQFGQRATALREVIVMYKIVLQLTLCALFVSGCSVDAGRTEPLSPSRCNTQAARYNGQTVVVRGYIKLASEGHALYESHALDEEFRKGWDSGSRDFDARRYEKYCLTIANPDLLYRNQAAVNGKTLILKGKFIANYLDGNRVDLGACPLPTAIIIDESDLRHRYRWLLTAK